MNIFKYREIWNYSVTCKAVRFSRYSINGVDTFVASRRLFLFPVFFFGFERNVVMSKSLMVHCPNFSSSSKREGGFGFHNEHLKAKIHAQTVRVSWPQNPPASISPPSPPSTMSSALYSFISSITNNITSRYDVKSQIASAGLWKIYSANRKTTGQQVAIFVSF
jgi:hypothetical protein